MTDFMLVIDFFVNCALDFWNVVNKYWFIVVPFFTVMIINVLLVVLSIVPGNHNRKH